MTEEELESFAAEFLQAHEISRLPVDPFELARRERIHLLPGQYDNCFDARLEYRKKAGVGSFYLFYTEDQWVYRPQERTRFSIAHELGHYFLPHHRQALLSGQYHNSRTDFISNKPLEQEADAFASALLMPREFFMDHVHRKNGGFCTLKNLLEFSNIFRTSLTSTALRYTKLNFEPCCVVLSKNQQIQYSWASEDLKTTGSWWIDWKAPVPVTSVTAKLRTAPAEFGKWVDGRVSSDVWFESRRSSPAWEEAVVLGKTGLTLTFLALEAEESYDD